MRGVLAVGVTIIGLFAVVLVAGAVLDPLVTVVAGNDAVQAQGWDAMPADIRAALFTRAVPLAIGVAVAWAVIWYLRRERLVGRRR